MGSFISNIVVGSIVAVLVVGGISYAYAEDADAAMHNVVMLGFSADEDPVSTILDAEDRKQYQQMITL